ncbi:pyridoxamine 5'-phosphate oxidase family protein [Aquabacterium sp. OR-4]|uniref:pyridoxamine 5'-phosphate oxidase family protein n=1 Tax=Aquabacterium sp. OR-4 TaxID=2978127 RepID=UPI0021B17E56|nr:pyridoxamine 5'-phosphate oxidase family protein [Aquabacterium sp. OR-4]MDT7835031.1 pyridoxamine 5'-phosphate oxidase family protein [Aquabacterium sp. OR-4]
MISDETLERLDQLLDGERVAMLTRWTPDGLLHSKPMTVLQHDAGGAFWFYVRSVAGQDDDEVQYRHVNLAFSNPDKGRHVSLAGQGRIVRDRALIESLWTAAAKPWFPDGPQAPELALLEIIPTHAEYWDGPSNVFSRALAMAASIAAGKPIGLGEHAEIDLTAGVRP